MALLGPGVQNRGLPYQPTNSWRNEKIFSREGCNIDVGRGELHRLNE
jgi:hypothetical protein